MLGGCWVIMVFLLFELYAFDMRLFQESHVPLDFSQLHIRWIMGAFLSYLQLVPS